MLGWLLVSRVRNLLGRMGFSLGCKVVRLAYFARNVGIREIGD